jgi:hypothetical protein
MGMGTESNRPVSKPGPLGRMMAAIGVAALLKRNADGQLDEDKPEAIWPTKRSEVLMQSARQFAVENDSSDSAVQKLRSLSKGHGRDLSRAAAEIRFQGGIDELRQQNLSNRLLQAAASDCSVTPLTQEEEEWFDRTGQLDRFPEAEAFEFLVSLEPALAAFEDQVRTQSAGIGEGHGQVQMWNFIIEGLGPIVGPSSRATDPLLRTQLAFDRARIHLARTIGLQFSD